MSQDEIICIGASAHDTHIYVNEAHTHRSATEHTTDLALPFGVKLNCQSLTHTIGGNAANVAVGLTRLGFKSFLITWIGQDDQGKFITSCLKKENIKTFATTLPTSNQSIILHCNAERTIIAHHPNHKYKISKDHDTNHIYLSSMGQGSEHIIANLLKQSQQGTLKTLAWNPGNYQINMGKKIIPLLKKTTILFLNKEEAILLQKTTNQNQESNHHHDHPIELLATKIQHLGPSIVIITDGKKGAWVSTNNTSHHIEASQVNAIDATGAGDAFAAAFYATYLRQGTTTECLRAGTHNSSSVIQQIGAQPGLLTAKELAHKIMTNTISVRQIP